MRRGKLGAALGNGTPPFCATLALMELGSSRLLLNHLIYSLPFDDTFETGYLSKYRRKQQGRFIAANVTGAQETALVSALSNVVRLFSQDALDMIWKLLPASLRVRVHLRYVEKS